MSLQSDSALRLHGYDDRRMLLTVRNNQEKRRTSGFECERRAEKNSNLLVSATASSRNNREQLYSFRQSRNSEKVQSVSSLYTAKAWAEDDFAFSYTKDVLNSTRKTTTAKKKPRQHHGTGQKTKTSRVGRDPIKDQVVF